VTSAGELTYDALVIALGAELDLDGLPGLRKAIARGIAGEYYSLEGAAALSTRLREIDGGRICLVVSRIPFKCPAAPYEGALLIDDLLVERGVREEVALCVISPEPHPMPVAGPVVGEALVSMLQERRIGYQPKTAVEGIDPEASELVLEDGGRHSFDFLVVVPPHRAPRPVREAGFSEAGWIPVDPRTLATKVPDVWALGDVSMLKLANDLPLPKAGIFAMEQAKAVAAGIAERFGVDAPKPWFGGEGYCYVEVGGGKAAKGVGSFLERSGPVVHLYGPSAEHHEDKALEEREWLDRWAGMRRAVNAGA
jgi:sulfide:quinone oxidoreductase